MTPGTIGWLTAGLLALVAPVATRGVAAQSDPRLVTAVRDAQEDSYVVSRIDQARVDKILSEHDPFKSVS